MSHPDEGVLQAMLDEELTTDESAEVHAHLSTCAACEQRVIELRAIMVEAGGLVERIVLEGAVGRGRARQGEIGRGRAWLGGAGIAASLLVAVTAGLMLRPGTDGQRVRGSDGQTVRGSDGQRPVEESAAPVSDTLRFRSGPAAVATPATPPARQKQSVRVAPSVQQPASVPAALAAPREEKDARANELLSADAEAESRRRVSSVAKMLDEVAVAAGSAEVARGRRGIEQLKPDSLVRAPTTVGDAMQPTYRTVYSIDGTQVVLEEYQGVTGRDRARQGVAQGVAQGAVRRDRARPGEQEHAYRWEVAGDVLVLRGALPMDSLAALAKRVK